MLIHLSHSSEAVMKPLGYYTCTESLSARCNDANRKVAWVLRFCEHGCVPSFVTTEKSCISADDMN